MQRRPSLVPDLFHIKRTTVEPGSPPIVRTEICGTYTDLDSAQKVALRRLEDEGLSRDSLGDYATNDITQPSSAWKHGENVVVHARKGDEVHDVEIETTPNSLGVRSKPGDGRVEDNLFYVLCTVQAADGSTHTEIRGIHLSRQAAVAAARHELVSGDRKQDWYKDYKEEVGVGHREEDVEGHQLVVTATGEEGEKYIVSVIHES
ncbi:uncharacterized protein Z520_09821 [Fonsecaea multimorphosa CBS 102226]|uniref:Uncharacterized protein n=1 Tax=Fonsecaea multimorphosa CBS 102226 TaxID=1442371 RepID=A0A0D2GY29_9EURO|nr:uncharacterized protein Z520_09821 [Fonsecaea multimorphosa CBS 102226]KIX94435.1 hypothetical protein Z520_09821 [Fonsecaea multimorphosa CBS 102226]OAL20016.1 hypothetical protein AYO22_09166 [Fonsecaea multimorphosa]